jgi:hypothetical protein
MAKGEFFSFGDEDLERARGEHWTEIDAPQRSTVGDVADPTPNDPVSAPDPDAPHPGERARRSRGDSETGSSAKREPSPLRVQSAVVLALALGAALAVGILLAATAGDQPAVAPPSTVSGAASRVVRQRAPLAEGAQARRAQLKREGAVEPQRARRREAPSRRRARRRRRGRLGEAHGRRAAAGPPPAPSPAPAYLTQGSEAMAPPASVPEPPPQPSPGEGHLRDGSNAPEFGL